MKKQLDLSNCTKNEEVSELIKKRVREVTVSELVSELSSDFVYHEEATRKIYVALATGKNSILYGPGGFGKSVLVKAICKYLGLPVVYKIGYSGMTAEELLGIPNMTVLLEESKYETAFENSVFSKSGILILEEFFDTDPSTAAALKDVLTEKGFRENDVKKESMISSVIITGNRTPEDVCIDDSTSAFYKERFPMRHRMVWNNFSNGDYLKFFNVYFKDKYKENFEKFVLLSKLCAGTEEKVSPRVAAQAGDIMLELGISFIDTVEGIDTTEIEKIKIETEEELKGFAEREVIDNMSKYLDDIVIESKSVNNYIKVRCLKSRFELYEFSEPNVKAATELFGAINEVEKMIYRFIESENNVDAIFESIDALIKK